MQHDLTPVDVNSTPRPESLKPLTDNQITMLSYLGSIALRKKFVASLIVNLYNSHIVGADMYHLVGYLKGESCNTLEQAIILLCRLSQDCESHEIYGIDFVESLIEQWDFRGMRDDE